MRRTQIATAVLVVLCLGSFPLAFWDHAQTSFRYSDSGLDPARDVAIMIFVAVVTMYTPSIRNVIDAATPRLVLRSGAMVAGVGVSTALAARAIEVQSIVIPLTVVSALFATWLTRVAARMPDTVNYGADHDR